MDVALYDGDSAVAAQMAYMIDVTVGNSSRDTSTVMASWRATDSWTASSGELEDGRGKPWSTIKQPVYVVGLLAVAYVTVAIVGLVSNALVIAVVYGQPRMRTVTNRFLSNLAAADILVCLLVLPITLLQNVYTGIIGIVQCVCVCVCLCYGLKHRTVKQHKKQSPETIDACCIFGTPVKRKCWKNITFLGNINADIQVTRGLLFTTWPFAETIKCENNICRKQTIQRSNPQ